MAHWTPTYDGWRLASRRGWRREVRCVLTRAAVEAARDERLYKGPKDPPAHLSVRVRTGRPRPDAGSELR
jgi:hypothetical protein